MNIRTLIRSAMAVAMLALAGCGSSKGDPVSRLAKDMVPIPGRNYSMCRYEVTQALWEAVMGENPSEFKGADRPVEEVSWNDCQKFLEKLNALPEVKAAGVTYRLPTADEWEYACRAGATGDYCKLADGTEITEDTLGEVAWYYDNCEIDDRRQTHPVGQKKPNAFGLYDMHGNVWEWTSTAVGYGRVSCGGSWSDAANFCEAGFRYSNFPDFRYYILGFRLAGAMDAKRAASERKALAKASNASLAKLAADMVAIPGKDYSMCRYEVTQALWEAVMGENPSWFKGADLPVEKVSWYDCQKFLEKLNALPEVKESGFTYRLPTADEWEYACRAGATGDYCKLADGTEINENTLREVAWYIRNSFKETHPVGQKKPNAFGLYDMHGNVRERTSTADGDGRVNCGGSWYDVADFCRASLPSSDYPGDRRDDLGFRLAGAMDAKRAASERKALAKASNASFAKFAADMVAIPGKGYSMCRYEVTQALWEAVMGENPSEFKGADRPVENVSWDDCQKFLEKLNALPEVKAAGVTYRLPTADEWEFACRAGATGDYCKLADGTEITKDTLGEVAWYEDGHGQTHPVGQKKPNAFGLYDMHGNVLEWTSSAGGYGRVYCGGGWGHDAIYCEAGSRLSYSPDFRCSFLGFRLAR